MNVKQLKERLSYDPATGLFTWLKSNSKKPIVGTVAGTLHDHGYIRIKVGEKLHYAHRLAWLYVHGEFPAHEIDHIDRNPSNNRIANLRLATHAQNSANTPKRRTNACGFKGVCRHQGRWMARINNGGKGTYLGMFDTAEEAYAAYLGAAKMYYKEFHHP